MPRSSCTSARCPGSTRVGEDGVEQRGGPGRAAGRDRHRRRRDRAPDRALAVGAELGGARQRRRCGGRRAALSGLVPERLELGGQRLVGRLGGRSEMPRPLRAADDGRKRAVGGAARARRGRSLDSGAHDGVREGEPARIDDDHPGVLRRREHVEAVHGSAQRRGGAIGAERCDEQCLAGRGRQRFQPASKRDLQTRADGQGRGQRPAAVPLVLAQLGGRLDQRQRVAADGVHERFGDRGSHARSASERQRVRAVELPDGQDRDARPGLERLAALRPHGDRGDADIRRAAGDERDRLPRRRVEPLHIVDQQQQRLVFGGGRQQRDRGVQHPRAVGVRRLLERQGAMQRPTSGRREGRVVSEQRLEQRGETRPREGDLALRRGHVDHAHPPGRVHGVEQRGLADARSAHDRDRRAAPLMGAGRELVQSRQVVRTSQQRGPLPVIRDHAANATRRGSVVSLMRIGARAANVGELCVRH